jgi:hypothetical protein
MMHFKDLAIWSDKLICVTGREVNMHWVGVSIFCFCKNN